MNSIATEQLWIDFGLDSAVFLDFIAHWIKVNSGNKQPRNFFEGRYWTYNTLDALHIIFPGWSKDTIRSIIRRCVKNGLLIVNNFNKNKYDRTNWYTLSDLALKYYTNLSHLIHETPDNLDGDSCGDLTAPCGQITTPIPKQLTTISNINITISDIVETYHEELPELPKVRRVDSKLKGQLSKMVKEWPSYQKEGKPFSIESFKDYLNLLKQHYSWFLKPYTTDAGNTVKSSLRKLTREINITRIVNGEFSAT